MPEQTLDCTNCKGTFKFTMSFERDGDYEIPCPDCNHIHYRRVRDGLITDIRYDPNPSSDTGWITIRTYGFTATATATSTAGWVLYDDDSATDCGTAINYIDGTGDW